MRVQAKDARITLLVGGVPLQVVPVRDLRIVETPPRHAKSCIPGNGYSITLECVGEPLFDTLWYDMVYHQTALDRWADDGGAVSS